MKEKLLHLSASKIKTFSTCKAKYRFLYIDHLPKIERDFQVFGKCLHESLENFCRSLLNKEKKPDNVLMKRAFDGALKTWGNKLTTEQKNECFKILKEYLYIRAHNELPKIIGVEKDFSITINNSILLNGFIDVVYNYDDVLYIDDYKTSKTSKYLKKDLLQLKTYAYAMMHDDPSIETVKCSYVMLRLNFERIEKEFKRKEIMKLPKQFLEYAEKINAEKLYRPSTGPLCKFCDYLSNCEAGRKYVMNGSDSFGLTEW